MAILFMDGFDYFDDYTPSCVNGRWTYTGSTVYFRRSTNTPDGIGASVGLDNGVTELHRTIPDMTTCFVGFHFYAGDPIADNQRSFVKFYDGATYQCRIDVDKDTLKPVLSDSGATELVFANTAVTFGVWHYIEIKVIIDNTVGGCEIRMDGETILNSFTHDTQGTANNTINKVGITGTNAINYFDNFYVADTTGGQDFIGPAYVHTIRPDAAGTSAQFTPSAGSNHETIDEEEASSTDYNSSSTTGNLDRFSHSNLPTEATTVHALQITSSAQVNGAGARKMKNVVYDGTTEGEGTEHSLNASYQYYQDIFEDHPTDANPWTPAEVNAGEFGYKVTG